MTTEMTLKQIIDDLVSLHFEGEEITPRLLWSFELDLDEVGFEYLMDYVKEEVMDERYKAEYHPTPCGPLCGEIL